MDKRLSGPAYLYDGLNNERGGLVTRQTLVKKDPHGLSKYMESCCVGGAEQGGKPGDPIIDKDGAAWRERL